MLVAFFVPVGCSRKSAEQYLARGKEHLWQFEYKGDPHEGELAIEDFSRAIRLKPADAEAYIHRATAKKRLYPPPRWREALADADHAITLVSGRAPSAEVPPMYSQRAAIRRDLHDLDGAIADFSEALKLAKVVTGREESFPDAYLLRGGVYEEKGDFQSATRDYEASLKIAPSDWWSRGRAEEALRRVQAKR